MGKSSIKLKVFVATIHDFEENDSHDQLLGVTRTYDGALSLLRDAVKEPELTLESEGDGFWSHYDESNQIGYLIREETVGA